MAIFHSKSAAPCPLEAVDAELRRAATRLHRMPAARQKNQDLIREHIDELLDRRLQVQQDTILATFERSLSSV